MGDETIEQLQAKVVELEARPVLSKAVFNELMLGLQVLEEENGATPATYAAKEWLKAQGQVAAQSTTPAAGHCHR